MTNEPVFSLAILGWPVAHSRSPAMHNAALRYLGLKGGYIPIAVPPERLAKAVQGIRDLGLRGVNITVPHKQTVIALLDEITPDARLIGAVNTIVSDNGRLVGHNTDAPGLVAALTEANVTIKGKRVVILGAGGAARAAVVGVARAGATQLVAARRAEQAEALASAVSPAFPASSVTHASFDPAALTTVFASADLIVQTTSATLGRTQQAQDFANAMPLAAVPKHCVINDVVYDPLQTALLQRATAQGLSTVDGLGMLVHQGAEAFELWTGQAAPRAIMRAALD